MPDWAFHSGDLCQAYHQRKTLVTEVAAPEWDPSTPPNRNQQVLIFKFQEEAAKKKRKTETDL